jgi:diguanylate cyclase (GGDEF)-like protein/PAS domain S-box-containing protein
LVVDDDDDVHAVTRLVLASFSYAGRGLRLLHARSAGAAEATLRAGEEVAVILLDVAMETPTAGLDLTRLVRDELNIRDTRIVLRTGRQEQFPERDIILRYDINDYRSHTELDETRLLSTVVTAIRAYDRLRTIASQRDELRRLNQRLEERIVERTAEVREGESRLRSILETTVLPIFITSRADGMVLFANASASRLLGLGPGRHDQPIWCHGEDRAALLARLDDEQRIDDHEAQVRTPEGNRFWALIAAITMSLDGEPAYLLTFNDISARKAMEDELRRLATTDPLTGIFNRRHLMDQGERELRRARRYGTDLSLLILDIDHFKAINDTHGHAVGDDALKALVRVCLAHLREIDLMCRLGGEEFVAILPETSGEAALIAAERLRAAVERLEVPLAGSDILRFTVSVGTSALRPDDASLADVLTRADEALYEAKGAGRNRVRVLL